MRFLFIIVFLCVFLVGCEQLAILTTPKKQPKIINTSLSRTAEEVFWQTLHAGDYDRIPEALKLQTAAYLENPYSPIQAAHLGFLHIWKITERNRRLPIPPTIVDEIILARQYFADAVELFPHDARYQGFYGDSILMTGHIFHNERTKVRGYFQLLHAIHMWPEFNYFSGGFVMSTLPITDKHFKEGLEWQWKTLSLCSGHSITRDNPDFSPYMHLETQIGSKRACWNSWIAPHNFEGFFLNMGDMLVKAGDWPTAIKIYKNARLSRTYEQWPYKNMLEKRIQNAPENVNNFRDDDFISADKTILLNNGYGCSVCHQKTAP